jgi:N-methylhydantoinase A
MAWEGDEMSRKVNKNLIIGVDTGGTFTDVVILTGPGEAFSAKAPTTPHDFSVGVLDAVGEAAKHLHITRKGLLQKCSLFKHGTTVGTNSVLTRSGARSGFITTKGFEDTTIIGRSIQRVDGLTAEEIKHMAYIVKPEPIVPKSRIRGVYERVDYAGNVVVPINEDDAQEAIRSLVEDEGVEAIAVSFLFGWVNPIHEKRMKELIAEMYPRRELHLTFAHELIPVVREYGRANTVILNSFIGPTMEQYLDDLKAELVDEGFEGSLLIMQANGGAVRREEVAPVRTLSSGPAGGVIASQFMATLLGHQNVISTDMGGTSFDVSLIIDQHWRYAREPIVSRWRVIQPMIEVESIGAGGGSIASVDPLTGRLLVGPQSAGASPGPACYGAGGQEPTVTDADLVLGILNPDYFLGGRVRLDRERAERAIKERVADPLRMGTVEAAAGIFDIVNSQMGDLIRRHAIRAGHVPSEFVVYSFGGAGAVHAASYAAELGIEKIYIFPTSAVFSAFGIAAADVIHTRSSSHRYLMPVSAQELNYRLESIEEELALEMEREGFSRDEVEFRRTAHMRYRRQMNELDVVIPSKKYNEEDIMDILTLWEAKFEQIYGKGVAYRQAGIELISIDIDAIGRAAKPTLRRLSLGPANPEEARKGTRRVFFTGEIRDFLETPVYEYERLHPGNAIEGPAIIESPITTVLIPKDRVGRVDEYSNIVLEM